MPGADNRLLDEGADLRQTRLGLDRLRVAWRKPMKFTPRAEWPNVEWDEQSGYPNDLVAGSPEHSGAHARLLELAVEMESDFEPYGKSSRGGDDCADCSCGCRHYASLMGRWEPTGASA
jgi:hypothetical protein